MHEDVTYRVRAERRRNNDVVARRGATAAAAATAAATATVNVLLRAPPAACDTRLAAAAAATQRIDREIERRSDVAGVRCSSARCRAATVVQYGGGPGAV